MMMKLILITMCLAVPVTAPVASPIKCSATIWRMGQIITKIEAVHVKFNNPGGLMGRNGLQKFSSRARGEQAMLKLIRKYIEKQHTLISMFQGWAPDSVPGVYASLISNHLGISPFVPIMETCE